MSPFIIPIVAMLIPIVIVPTAIVFKHAKFERELEHAERMKALEVGRTLPQDEPWASPSRIILSIGAGVPIGVFAFSWLGSQAVGFHEEIWGGATGVSIASVICGSILAAKQFARAASATTLAEQHAPKDPIDADAFDVVSSRG